MTDQFDMPTALQIVGLHELAIEVLDPILGVRPDLAGARFPDPGGGGEESPDRSRGSISFSEGVSGSLDLPGLTRPSTRIGVTRGSFVRGPVPDPGHQAQV